MSTSDKNVSVDVPSENESGIVRIRPHHGLCMRHFEGKGYSAEFVKNMTNVMETLQEDTPVLLWNGGDVICAQCPNYKDGSCISRDKVMGYDAAVLNATGLRAGMKIPYGDFQEKIEEFIMKPQKIKEICGACQWAEICHKS